VSWGTIAGRSAEIAEALGGRAYTIFPLAEGKRLHATVRYVIGTVLTLAYLVREDPSAVVTTNPPVILGLIALGWARLRGIPFALDSHPGAFGRHGDRVSARLLPLHRFVARRASVTLVTADAWVETVHDWGGRGLVVHEAPGHWGSMKPQTRRAASRPQVLFVSRFSRDEPVEEAVAAAALVPEIDMLVTGRLEDLSADLAAQAPPNVSFVGFLPPERYEALVAATDLLVALTTEPTSVMRCAYEAVYARKPLLLSDWPICRELFPFAVAVSNDAESIAKGLKHAVEVLPELAERADEALELQTSRWQAQLTALVTALALPQPETEPRHEL
jgi:glycosyltransferase involved in cell wall biosynthesis